MRKKLFPPRRHATTSSNHISILFTIYVVGCCTFRAQAFMQRVATSIIVKRHAPPITQYSYYPHQFARRTLLMSSLQYIDAGANLLDSMYQGTYHSKPRHEPDLDLVLRRAYDKHVHKVISLAGTIKESEELMELIHNLDSEKKKEEEGVKVFGTVGVHPTRCAEVFAQETSPSTTEEGASWIPKTEQEQKEIIQQLIDLATRGKESGNIVAIGECGLDYARLQFCPKEIQQLGLRAQLEVAIETKLPLYLHNRESGDDLYGLCVRMGVIISVALFIVLMKASRLPTNSSPWGCTLASTAVHSRPPIISQWLNNYPWTELSLKLIVLGATYGPATPLQDMYKLHFQPRRTNNTQESLARNFASKIVPSRVMLRRLQRLWRVFGERMLRRLRKFAVKMFMIYLAAWRRSDRHAQQNTARFTRHLSYRRVGHGHDISSCSFQNVVCCS